MFSIYAKIAAALALLAALAGIYWKIHHDGVVSGRAEVQADWDADKNSRKVAEEKAIADRLRANELRVKQNEDEKAKLKESYANEISTLRAARAKPVSLRVHTDNCQRSADSSKTNSASTSVPDTAGTGLLSSSDSETILSLMDQADEIVAGCRVAQDFLKSQGMAP